MEWYALYLNQKDYWMSTKTTIRKSEIEIFWKKKLIKLETNKTNKL